MTDRTPNSPPPPPSPPSDPLPDEPVRRSASPLLWILVLLALLAFGWFVYNQRAGETAAPEPPPPVIGSGDDRDAAAERERAADDARRRARDDAREQPQARAPTAPDRDPVPRARVEPDYPVEAYRAREEGTVLVSATVGTDGSPRDVQVLRRSGSRQLDQAALDAVARWTFDPAIRGGRPTEAEVQVPVTFRIDR